jgi:hypothetical protein
VFPKAQILREGELVIVGRGSISGGLLNNGRRKSGSTSRKGARDGAIHPCRERWIGEQHPNLPMAA